MDDLQLGNTKALIDECRKQGLPRNHAAYVLATAYHETAHTMKPIYERGERSYFDKYDAGTRIGKRLGNTVKGDGFKYRGAGYCQLTGRANFIRAGKKVGVDLVNNPSKALDPLIAADIIVTGMREGWFTGKRLSDYLTATKSDYKNARRIINSLDRAQLIANYAGDYEMSLEVIGYAKGKPTSARPASLATITPIEAKPVPAPAPVTDKELIRRVQLGLTALRYNPGGADGKLGPLTAGAIRIFRADNGLPEGDVIDDELITALASAKPREMVPERANATGSEIAAKIPEANAHSWNKIVALGSGVATAAGGALDQIAPATGYLQPVKDFLGDIPTSAWIAAIVIVAGLIWWNARNGQKAADSAYRTGDRR